MRIQTSTLKSAFALFLLISLHVNAKDLMRVQLRETVDVKSDEILFKDIIDSENTDLEFVQKYGTVALNDLNDHAEKIDQSKMMSALFKAGADIDQISFVKNRSVKLERGQKIELDDTQKAVVIAAISKSFHVPAQDVDIVSTRIMPKLSEIDQDGFKIKRVTSLNLSNLSRSMATAEVQDINGEIKIHQLYLKLNVETSVVSANRDFENEESLVEADVVSGRTELKSLTAPLLTNKEIKTAPLKFTKKVSKGEVLFSSDFKIAELVKEGSDVMLSYKTSMLNVSTSGKLLQNAEIGDVVKAENLESKRTVVGKLVSKDKIEVSYVKE